MRPRSEPYSERVARWWKHRTVDRRTAHGMEPVKPLEKRKGYKADAAVMRAIMAERKRSL